MLVDERELGAMGLELLQAGGEHIVVALFERTLGEVAHIVHLVGGVHEADAVPVVERYGVCGGILLLDFMEDTWRNALVRNFKGWNIRFFAVPVAVAVYFDHRSEHGGRPIDAR